MGSVKDRFLYFTFDLGSFSGPCSMSQITERLNTVWNSGFRPHFASASLKLNYLRIPLRDLLQYGMSILCWSLLHPPKVSGKDSFSLPPSPFLLPTSPFSTVGKPGFKSREKPNIPKSAIRRRFYKEVSSIKHPLLHFPTHTHTIFFHTVFKEKNK